MKSTGIVRRVDDLGRIVIPKEIRSNLKIHDGDSVEIYIDGDCIQLRKYSEFVNKIDLLNQIILIFNECLNKNICIFDSTEFFLACGNYKEKIINNNVSSFLFKFYNNRMEYLSDGFECIDITDNFSIDISLKGIPIIINGDIYCYLILFSDKVILNEYELNILDILKKILIKTIEE